GKRRLVDTLGGRMGQGGEGGEGRGFKEGEVNMALSYSNVIIRSPSPFTFFDSWIFHKE
ncbi:hypothetical protein SK128_020838, partial [Halocaridina rubra]